MAGIPCVLRKDLFLRIGCFFQRSAFNPLRHIHTLHAAQRAPFSFPIREHCTAFCDFRVKGHRLSYLFFCMVLQPHSLTDDCSGVDLPAAPWRHHSNSHLAPDGTSRQWRWPSTLAA